MRASELIVPARKTPIKILIACVTSIPWTDSIICTLRFQKELGDNAKGLEPIIKSPGFIFKMECVHIIIIMASLRHYHYI